MASVVDICNLALAHLADAANISSIVPAEQSAQAEACARFYPLARDQVLEAADWNFATRRVALAAVEGPPSSWRYAYAAPVNLIRAIGVLPATAADDDQVQDFILEASATGQPLVLTNTDQAVLRYVHRETDSTRFSPGYTTALSWLLASYLAGPVLKGKVGAAIKTSCERRYAVELSVASLANASARRTSTHQRFVPAHLAARGITPTETSWSTRE